MKNFVGFFIFSIVNILLAVDLPDLPKTPTLALSNEQKASAIVDDSAETWQKLAKQAKDTALSMASNGDITNATNWLYTSYALEMLGKEGVELPIELKRDILDNIPVFFDFYETISKRDSLSNALNVLKEIYLHQPAVTKKYLRAAMAVSLIYDAPLPPDWPECNVPEEPTQIQVPQELFLFFSQRANKLPFDMSKLTMRELIYMFGIAGPLSELEKVVEDDFAPYSIPQRAEHIKTDTKRERGSHSKKWDTEKEPFTLENIKKLGATTFEKTFYVYRVANANGVPCLYYCGTDKGRYYSWLAYMNKAGEWVSNVYRDPLSKNVFGAPLNPQTWRLVSDFDFYRLPMREIINEKISNGIILTRFAKEFYDADKFELAKKFAKDAIASDAENSNAHAILIPASARSGATTEEIDNLYKNSISAFSKYPEKYFEMINLYRENLILRKKQKEADDLFNSAIKPLSRRAPTTAIIIYGDVIIDMYNRAESPSKVLSQFSQLTRLGSKDPSKFYTYIAKPTIEYFWNKKDSKNAFKALNITERAVRSNKYILDELKRIKENYNQELKDEKANSSSVKKTTQKGNKEPEY